MERLRWKMVVTQPFLDQFWMFYVQMNTKEPKWLSLLLFTRQNIFKAQGKVQRMYFALRNDYNKINVVKHYY